MRTLSFASLTKLKYMLVVYTVLLIQAVAQKYTELWATKSFNQISSPRFPSHYENYLFLSWTITTVHNKIIRIETLHLDIVSDDSCSDDYLRIFDGPDRESLPQYTWCGKGRKMMFSSGNQVYLVFKTDAKHSGRGFKLRYKAEKQTDSSDVPKMLTAIYNRQYLYSPNYPNKYPRFSHCKWLIETDVNNVVEISVEDSKLEYSRNCASDNVTVYDGSMEKKSPVLGWFCGRETPVFRSTNSSLLLVFLSDGRFEHQGFKISYYALQVNVGNSPIVGVILGCVIGFPLVIALIILVIFCTLKERRKLLRQANRPEQTTNLVGETASTRIFEDAIFRNWGTNDRNVLVPGVNGAHSQSETHDPPPYSEVGGEHPLAINRVQLPDVSSDNVELPSVVFGNDDDIAAGQVGPSDLPPDYSEMIDDLPPPYPATQYVLSDHSLMSHHQ